MNKKIVFMGILALFGAMHTQSNAVHKMACININSAGSSAGTSGGLVAACEYPLSEITCAYADFAYTTAEGYRCFVKFDPTKVTPSKALNAPAFAEGTGTTAQNCGFINFNAGSNINFAGINKAIQSTSVARKSYTDLAAALNNNVSQLMIEYCLTPGKMAVTDAMTFLGNVAIPKPVALSLAQQKQQALAIAQQKAAARAQAISAQAQAAKAKAAAAQHGN
ncbi:MAG: hypothetical protein P4L31_06860 [Candidatus Babeliales bacterium]|nr:hypothetical protein [Candidatus Babeliales bacterium]